MIRARPIGESVELFPIDDSTPHIIEPLRTKRESRYRRSACSRGVARGWANFVSAAGRFIQQKRSAVDQDDQPNSIAAPGARRVGFLVGCRRLVLIACWDVIHPDSPFRAIWDNLIMVMLLYVAFVTTYILCFMFNGDGVAKFHDAVDMTINVFFLLDIFFNFRTGVRKSEDAIGWHQIITRRPTIARRYLRGWFTVDLIAGLPWGKMLASLMSYMQITKMLRLIRLLRLLKLLKLFKLNKAMQRNRMYKNMEHRQGVAMARVAVYGAGGILVVHLAACAWYFSAVMEDPELDGTWAAAVGLQTVNNFQRYLTSLYFVIITFTTAGYGDVAPMTTAERLLACAGMLMGVVTLGYIISTAKTIMGNANKYEISKVDVQERVEEFLSRHALPTRLAGRVKAFYGYVSKKQFNDERDKQLLKGLPTELQRTVLRDVHASLIRRMPLLSSLRGHNEALVLELAACLKLEFYGKDECVVVEGGWDTELYFVTEGRLDVLQYQRGLTSPRSILNTLLRTAATTSSELHLSFPVTGGDAASPITTTAAVTFATTTSNTITAAAAAAAAATDDGGRDAYGSTKAPQGPSAAAATNDNDTLVRADCNSPAAECLPCPDPHQNATAASEAAYDRAALVDDPDENPADPSDPNANGGPRMCCPSTVILDSSGEEPSNVPGRVEMASTSHSFLDPTRSNVSEVAVVAETSVTLVDRVPWDGVAGYPTAAASRAGEGRHGAFRNVEDEPRDASNAVAEGPDTGGLEGRPDMSVFERRQRQQMVVAAAAFDAAAAVAVPTERHTHRMANETSPPRRKWRWMYDGRGPPYAKSVRRLSPGDHFGEYACLTGCPRTATVITRRMCELYALSRKRLAAVMCCWPDTAATWEACQKYGEEQRALLRQHFPGGRAPHALSQMDDASSSRWRTVDDDPVALSGLMRYQHFLMHFQGSVVGGGGNGGGEDSGGGVAERAW